LQRGALGSIRQIRRLRRASGGIISWSRTASGPGWLLSREPAGSAAPGSSTTSPWIGDRKYPPAFRAVPVAPWTGMAAPRSGAIARSSAVGHDPRLPTVWPSSTRSATR